MMHVKPPNPCLRKATQADTAILHYCQREELQCCCIIHEGTGKFSITMGKSTHPKPLDSR